MNTQRKKISPMPHYLKLLVPLLIALPLVSFRPIA